MKRLSWIVAAVLVAGAGLAAVTLADASPAARYRVATVAKGDVAQTVTVSGTADHVNRADVAFGTDGTVATLTVSPGDTVTAGQELGTLDTTDLEAAVSKAESQVAVAQDALDEDEAAQEEAAGRSDELASNQDKVRTAQSAAGKALKTAADALAAQGKACAEPESATCTAAVTATRDAQESVQRAQTTLQAAIEALANTVPTQPESAGQVAESQASVDEAAAKLVEAEQALAGATVTAPIAGTVGAVTVVPGDAVGAGTTVVTIIGAGAAVVTATVPLAQLENLAVGQEAVVTPAGTSTEVAGTVTKVGTLPDAAAETVAYPVTITVPESPAAMAAGSVATATITVAAVTDVLTVPTSAVRRGIVTVLSGDQTSPVRVTTGAVGLARTEIKDGLAEGDQVVLADLDSPVPTSDQPSFGGPVRMMR